jgi:hypothetical protein
MYGQSLSLQQWIAEDASTDALAYNAGSRSLVALPTVSWMQRFVFSEAQAMVSMTPPSTRSAAPVVAEAWGEQA